MRLVTSLCLVLAALSVVVGPTQAAPPSGGTSAAVPASPPPASLQAAPQASGKAVKPSAARPTPVPGSRMGERRRRSYASCNRESHRRELRGGARRRFLIRCKLGLERRTSAPSSPAGGAAQPSGKRP